MTPADGPIDPELLLRENGWLLLLARRLVGDADAADELVQETWMRFASKPPDRRESLRAWLARVLRRLVVDRHRSESRRREREKIVAHEEAIRSSPQDLLARTELRRDIVQSVVELQEPYRTMVILRFFEEATPREIAERTQTSIHTVNTRLRRALEILRIRLDHRHGSRESWLGSLLFIVRPFEPAPVFPETVGIASTASQASTLLGAPLMSTKITLASMLAIVVTLGLFWATLERPGGPEISPDGLARSGSETANLAREFDGESSGEKEDPSSTGETSMVTEVEEPAPALVGRVTAEGDVPVPQARVFALASRSWEDQLELDERLSGFEDIQSSSLARSLRRARELARTLPRQLSDDGGNFSFAELEEGDYRIIVLHSHHLPRDAGIVSVVAGQTSRHDVHLIQGHEIRGTVKDEAGRSVVGARVEARASSERLLFGKSRREALSEELRTGAFLLSPTPAITDAEGRWKLTTLEPRPQDLEASKEGFVTAQQRDIAVDGSPVELILRSGFSLRGRLVDERDLPIPDARVILRRRPLDLPQTQEIGMPLDQYMVPLDFEPGATESIERRSGIDGRFEFTALLEREYDFVVEAGDRPHLSRRVSVTGPTDLGDILLAPGTSIEGQVVDELGRPVDRALVWIEATGDTGIAVWGHLQWRPESLVETRSLPDGSFKLEGLPVGIFQLRAVSTRLAAGNLSGIQPGQTGVRIQLPAGHRVAGVVLDGDTGLPIVGARVSLTETRARVEAREKQAWTDPEGRFTIEGAPRGDFGLAVTHPDYTHRPHPLHDPDPHVEHEIRLFAPREVRGIVVNPGGQRVPGARLSIIEENGKRFDPGSRSGIRGSFRLLLPGKTGRDSSFTIEASAPGQGFGSSEPIRPTDETSDVEILLEKTATLTALILDSETEAVARAIFRLTPENDASRSRISYSDRDGSLTLEGIEPGTHRIEIRAIDHAPLLDTVEITRDDLNLEFTLDRGRQLSGTIVDSDGIPVSDAQIFVIESHPMDEVTEDRNPHARRRRREDGRAVETVRTGADGVYEFSHLPASDLTVFARAAGFIQSDLHFIPAETSRHDFVLVRYSRIRGLVVDSLTHRPIPDFQVWVNLQKNLGGIGGSGMLLPRQFASPDGSFLIEPVKPGEYFLVISSPGRVTRGHFLDLTPGLEESLRIELDPGALVSGVVKDATDGHPVAGVSVALRNRSREAWTNRIFSSLRTTTALDGSFAIGGLEDGKYHLHLNHPDFVRNVNFPPVLIEDGRAVDLDLELPRSGELVVRIHRSDRRRPPFEMQIQLVSEARDKFRHHTRPASTTIQTVRVPSIPPGTYDAFLVEKFFNRQTAGGERIDLENDVDVLRTPLGEVEIRSGETEEAEVVVEEAPEFR